MKEVLPWLVHFDRRAYSTQPRLPAQLFSQWGQRNQNSVEWGKKICTGPTRAAKANKDLLYRHDKRKEPTKEGPLSFVLFESPFSSVSTVSKDHPCSLSGRAGTKDFVLPWLLKSQPSIKKYFPRLTFSLYYSHWPATCSCQSCWVASLCVSGPTSKVESGCSILLHSFGVQSILQENVSQRIHSINKGIRATGSCGKQQCACL
jgi:hypothetical protein